MLILPSAIISLAFALLFLNGLPVLAQEIGELIPASIRNRIVKLEVQLKQHPGDIRYKAVLAAAQLRAARKLSNKPEVAMQFLHRSQLLDHDQDLSSDYTESQTGEFDSLCQLIKLAWQPPREQNFESAKIKIRLFADGHFSQLKMIKESNSHSFNQSAIRALKKSAPFTALPANFPRDSSLVIHFQHIIGGPKIVLVMSLSQ